MQTAMQQQLKNLRVSAKVSQLQRVGKKELPFECSHSGVCQNAMTRCRGVNAIPKQKLVRLATGTGAGQTGMRYLSQAKLCWIRHGLLIK